MAVRTKRTADARGGNYTGADLAEASARIEDLEGKLAEAQRQAGHEELERLAVEERLEVERRAVGGLRSQLAAERTRARTQRYLAGAGVFTAASMIAAMKQVELLGTAVRSIFSWVDKTKTVVLLACPACGAAWAQDRGEEAPASGWRLCPRCLRAVPDAWEQAAAAVRMQALERQLDGAAAGDGEGSDA
jgi:hypothetical protein